MAKNFRKFNENDNDGDSFIWNDSKNYVGGKIHTWLIKIDHYEELATFGFKDVESDILINNPNLQNTARLKAMKRLIHAIKTLIRNTKFAIKKTDRDSFTEYTKRLSLIEKNLSRLKIEQKRGSKIVSININEELFEKMMNEIDDKIDDINIKLNKASLIFAQSEDLDIDQLKENLEKEFTQ